MMREAKDTKGKWRMSLIPGGYKSLKHVSIIREYGIEKYGDEHNWKKVDSRDYLDAAARHLLARIAGEKVDPESGYSHIWHCLCNLMFVDSREEWGEK